MNATLPAPAVHSSPSTVWDALLASLARGDEIDVALADAVCRQAGRSIGELTAAVAERVSRLKPISQESHA